MDCFFCVNSTALWWRNFSTSWLIGHLKESMSRCTSFPVSFEVFRYFEMGKVTYLFSIGSVLGQKCQDFRRVGQYTPIKMGSWYRCKLFCVFQRLRKTLWAFRTYHKIMCNARCSRTLLLALCLWCSTLKVWGLSPHRGPAVYAATSSREFNLPHVWGFLIQLLI